jgi:RNA polymerase sigma-70 factor (ECF subfamily)
MKRTPTPKIRDEQLQGYASLNDGQLLRLVLDSDEDAWRELLRRFRGLIFRCITKVICRYESVLSNEEVNEIYSDVCLNLLRNDMKKLRAYDPSRGSKLGSWIGLITIHTAYDHLRVTARQPLLDRLDGVVERADRKPTPLDRVLKKELQQHLNRLAAHFSDRDQRFIELYFGRGLSPAEVARQMNISVKTVYSKKHKIQNRLAEMASFAVPEALAA